jgi:ribosomal RNA-processing protein 17
MLRERAIENAAEVEKAYGAILGERNILTIWHAKQEPTPVNADADEEWTGISLSSEAKGKQKEEEYQDEEVLATVTVVEDFDPDTFIHGPPPTPRENHPAEPTPAKTPPAKVSRDKVASRKPSKGKKVKYETKAERMVQQTKQRARRTEKAELAGGKASRKKGPGASKKRGSGRR